MKIAISRRSSLELEQLTTCRTEQSVAKISHLELRAIDASRRTRRALGRRDGRLSASTATTSFALRFIYKLARADVLLITSTPPSTSASPSSSGASQGLVYAALHWAMIHFLSPGAWGRSVDLTQCGSPGRGYTFLMMKFALAALFALASSVLTPVVADVSAATNGGGHSPHPFTCPKYCKFPPHSTALCTPLIPCGFVCKDGYTPFPILFPVKCACPWPLTECNGKCGIHKACPSKGHHKRDLSASLARCPVGHSVCGILGRATGSWECVNTQKDLESCGGCIVSATEEENQEEGQDCTAIEGAADVSCVKGSCVVGQCIDGYTVSPGKNYCIPQERDKGIFSVAKDVLGVEFGA
ncbi:hypothetical protein NMY22_g9650 [Coprinellus aureogranulatus]|nr:hypothetical protein NMY22_g9650 [Coprinellus aureogranulatus]